MAKPDSKPEAKGPQYRKKGEPAPKEESTREDGAKAEKPKAEKPKEKNLVYNNPMEFKESRKFKNKQDEFFKGDWRLPQPSTYVTLDTVIPKLPKEVAQPDEAAFHKRTVELEDKIQALKKGQDDKQSQVQDLIDQKRDHRKGDGGASDDLKEKRKRWQQL